MYGSPVVQSTSSIPPEGEVNSAALPSDVVESLVLRTCDPGEIVHQLMQKLNLDKTCLKEPTPETTKMIRCFAAKAKISNRIDVVRHLRDIAPAGTPGEFLWSSIHRLV